MIAISFIGKKSSGKDTASLCLPDFQNIKIASSLKNMLRSFYISCGLGEKEIERRIEGDLKRKPDPYLCGKTPTLAMQTLGNEWGRKQISENIWNKSVYHQIEFARSKNKNIFFSDIRFDQDEKLFFSLTNKFDDIKLLVIKIVRPDINVDDHMSEKNIDNLYYDVEIINDKTIKDLKKEVLYTIMEFIPND